MEQRWQLQEAKNRFSEVVNRALSEGPQVVTRRGKEAVVIVSAPQYRDLKGDKDNLADFFQKSPLRGVKLDLTRDKSPSREVDL